MSASPVLLLSLYCAAIALFSLIGGMLPGLVRMTHTRVQLIMSFVSGMMLGVAFYHLLPHAIVLFPVPGPADAAVWWLMIGLVVMLLLLRIFHFHQHDFSDDDHAHHHHPQPDDGVAAHQLSWVGIALGLGVHSLIDGVALGAALQTAHAAGPTGLLGLGVFLAV